MPSCGRTLLAWKTWAPWDKLGHLYTWLTCIIVLAVTGLFGTFFISTIVSNFRWAHAKRPDIVRMILRPPRIADIYTRIESQFVTEHSDMLRSAFKAVIVGRPSININMPTVRLSRLRIADIDGIRVVPNSVVWPDENSLWSPSSSNVGKLKVFCDRI